MTADGKILWISGEEPMFGRGSMIFADGKLIIRDSYYGKLYLVKPDPAGFKQLASANPFGHDRRNLERWGPLAISNGLLLIRDEREIKMPRPAQKNNSSPSMKRFYLASLLSFVLALQASAEEKKPNIVFIMADDLGSGWVDYDDSAPDINTPNIQRLAESGMVFDRAYAACSVCSPTRAACLTGMSPAQIGLTTHIPGKAGNERKGPKGSPREAESLDHLPLDLPSYARELKKLGYATGFIGKWHLAGEGSIRTKKTESLTKPGTRSTTASIATSAAVPTANRNPGSIRIATAPLKTVRRANTSPTASPTKPPPSLKRIRTSPSSSPLWPYSVHTPIRAPKDLVEKNGGNAYRAMLESLDNMVGKVLDTLEATGKLDDTMVVFYSDNGGHVPTKWLADKKGSLLEGGLRVPMVVSWPGVIKPATTCDTPITSMDFFPTFVHAAGGSTASIEQLEGLDLKPLFEGEPELDRDALYWHFPHNRVEVSLYMGGTILEGDWKFYEGYGLIEDRLYDLKEDPMEKKNLIEKDSKRAQRMRDKLDTWLKSVAAKMPRENIKS